jgi:hypothetical protein
MVELLLQLSVAFLREECTALDKILHLGIIIDVEVLRTQDFPVELSVLNLVSAKIIELGRGNLNQEEQKESIFQTSAHDK